MKTKLKEYLEKQPLAKAAGLGILAGLGAMALGVGLIAATPLLAAVPFLAGTATLTGLLTLCVGASLEIAVAATTLQTMLEKWADRKKEQAIGEKPSPAVAGNDAPAKPGFVQKNQKLLSAAFAAALFSPVAYGVYQHVSSVKMLQEYGFSNVDLSYDGSVTKERCGSFSDIRAHFTATNKNGAPVEGVVCRKWNGESFTNSYPRQTL